MDRRTYLRTSASFLGAATLGLGSSFCTREQDRRFKIGACDWSIHQRGKLEAFTTGHQLGLDGVQISYRVDAEHQLLEDEEIQQAFLKEASSKEMAIESMALGILNQIPYKSDPRAAQWVLNSIDIAESMGINVVLLAFFGDGDIKNDPDGQQEVIRRLKEAAPKAEAAGVVLGIESWLSAREHVDIIDAVGSENVRVYYDVANSNKMGYDIYEEIRWLGKDLICEFHAKENGFLLGQGLVDFQEVRRAIDDIGYSGWIQIEGALPKDADLIESYVENHRVMREIFDT